MIIRYQSLSLESFGEWFKKDIHQTVILWQVDQGNRLFQLCRYMIKCCNKFFKMTRKEGVLMMGDTCTIAQTVGCEMNATWLQLSQFSSLMRDVFVVKYLYAYRPSICIYIYIYIYIYISARGVIIAIDINILPCPGSLCLFGGCNTCCRDEALQVPPQIPPWGSHPS